jgi:hypothetical protein
MTAGRSFGSESRAGLWFACCLAGCDSRLLMGFLRGPKRLFGVLHGLSRLFVSGQMVFFPVMCRSDHVRVRGLLMKFCGPLMEALRHNSSPEMLV